jgi:diketogulonate reductase-like aldo/keto reductase
MNAPAGTLQFPSRLGLGTWMMGESRAARSRELAAITHALQIGYRLFDTAEIYGNGGAERLLGQALGTFGGARRGELCIVSKVKPAHASRSGTVAACEASIERLDCQYLDLYLLHWPGPHAFEQTLQGFSDLLQRGLIRHFGVSNFDVEELQRWREAERRLGMKCTAACNQLYYCLQERGIEFELLGWQRAHRMQTMAYSPLGRGELARHEGLARLASRRGASAAQLALAWSMRDADVVTIPKSSDPKRIEQNWRARELVLDAQELAQLDGMFPPPRSRRPLETV